MQPVVHNVSNTWIKRIVLFVGMACVYMASVVCANALNPVSVSVADRALDITQAVENYIRSDGRIRVSTAPDSNGVVRRIDVSSRQNGGQSYWAVFALANNSNEQIDRLIVAPHYRLVGSGIIWPDLDSIRISGVTPSDGFALDRIEDDFADVFRITLDPGAIITFVAEKRTETLPKLYLWEPNSYRDTTNSYTLYYGIVLGISGLLALFLTILFLVRGTAVFPAAAILAWGVLAYVCVDFGFWNKIIGNSNTVYAFWRAGAEIAVAIGLLVFVYTYLSLSKWSPRFSLVTLFWFIFLLVLGGVMLFQPNIAAGMARFSVALTVVSVLFVIPYFWYHRFDRAIMLVPTWILLTAWIFAAFMAVMGGLANDIVQPALTGGLVLIVLLLGFTVMQHAFSGSAFSEGLLSETERSALAVAGSGDVIWDWEINRNRISMGEPIMALLNLERGSLIQNPKSWQKMLHPNDRDRFDATLNAMRNHKRGKISQSFRLRGKKDDYMWFKLRARPLVGRDGSLTRCVGTLTDINEQKKSEERILKDSTRDHLTGLENQEIFGFRLQTAIDAAGLFKELRPCLFYIDLDKFQALNSEHGYDVGDAVLMAISARLSKMLRKGDALSRLSGDQFLLMLLSEDDTKKIALLSEAIIDAVREPVEVENESYSMTASIGLVSWTADCEDSWRMIRDAELASIVAKRQGGDLIETFQPAFRTAKDDRSILFEDIKQAVSNSEIKVLYQPIVNLKQQTISGFEALVRWEHPRLGSVGPAEFVPLAERNGVIHELGQHVLKLACSDFSEITKTTGEKLFVSVNLSSRELLRNDIVADISQALQQSELPAQQLRLEVTESLVMENPEHSRQILSRIKNLGVGISLDDFGTGYSSFSYLLKFAFDTIKIDQSFIQNRTEQARMIVLQSIIGLGHSLDQSIIVEGVELEEDLAELMNTGCEYAQGYLFGEPMPIEEVVAVVEEEKAAD